MNKKEFIDWLIVKFMSNAEQRQAEIAVKDFEMTIPDDIDFDFLRVSILTHYEKRIMPDYKFMQQYFRKKTSGSYDNKWTATTWNIKAKAPNGEIYDLAYYMGVSEYQGREMLQKARPELEDISNDRAEKIKSYAG